MAEKVPAFLKNGPLLLSADNFTPLARTPWGGKVIGEKYKRSLVPTARGQAIGEAWEFSCDPTFPSAVLGQEKDLLALVREYPEAVLSPRASSGHAVELLVKLLDAAEPLSLQVHPADDDPHLGAEECGKPESWLVLDAAPGAGIYLGFSRPVSRATLRAALLKGDSAKDLLHFVAVKPGDYFEIEPGVPHCIGGGVTLLEPQRILQGKTGKTYRLWDWGRAYDASGQLDLVKGKPRPLHIDESLPLVDPERQVGEAFVATLRRTPRQVTPSTGAKISEFPANKYYQTRLGELEDGAKIKLGAQSYGALLVLKGELVANGKSLPAGQSALLPYAAFPLAFTAKGQSNFALITPVDAAVSIK